MKITKTYECHYCNYNYDVSFNLEDYGEWKSGKLIQEALPYLSDGERELMISSTCDNCWSELFGEDDED